MAMARLSDPTPRMTLPRALLSEALRLARSPLTAVHLVCGLAAGLACGEYFSVTRWDPALGADAYVQFLGALMPLMSAIVCGLAVDEERAAGRLANLTAVPSRGRAVAAKLLALAALGAGALAVALGVFGAALAVAGRLPLGPAPLAAAWAGIVLGSLPLYALWIGAALRLGRNAAIGAGAAGSLLAFFSVGGLAHGLMTGELTGALATPLSWVPLAWPARLGSLGVEAFIDAARAAGPLLTTALASLVLTLAADAVLLAWFCQITRARGVTLDAATGPAVAGAPEAPLDRTALARAAANLVANAAEHARSRVAVSCDVAGGQLVIEVADDGPGFSPAALERGCERLFTDDSSRSSRDGGRHYGLGLHVASEAASAHGGSVSLANSPSGGAVATIAVPLCGA